MIISSLDPKCHVSSYSHHFESVVIIITFNQLFQIKTTEPFGTNVWRNGHWVELHPDRYTLLLNMAIISENKNIYF
jgi:hypothetical protein